MAFDRTISKLTSVTWSNDDYTAESTASSTVGIVRTNSFQSTSKWNFRVRIDVIGGGGGVFAVGISYTTANVNSYLGSQSEGAQSAAFGYWNYGQIFSRGSSVLSGMSTFTTNDFVDVAFDRDTGEIWFGVNGVYHNSGDPAAGTNPTLTTVPTDLDWTPSVCLWGSGAKGTLVTPLYYDGFSPWPTTLQRLDDVTASKYRITINAEPVSPVLIDPSQLPAAVWTDSLSTGLDFAITEQDSLKEVKRQVLDFDTVGQTCEIWFANKSLATSFDIYYGSGVSEANSVETWWRTGDTAVSDSWIRFYSMRRDTATANKLFDETGNYVPTPTDSASNTSVEVTGLNGVGVAASYDGTGSQTTFIEFAIWGGAADDWSLFGVLMQPESDRTTVAVSANFQADSLYTEHDSGTDTVTVTAGASGQLRTADFTGITAAQWTTGNWFVGFVNDFTNNVSRIILNDTAATPGTPVTADISLRRIGVVGSNYRVHSVDHVGMALYAFTANQLAGWSSMLMTPGTYATYSTPPSGTEVPPDSLASATTLGATTITAGVTLTAAAIGSPTTVGQATINAGIQLASDSLSADSTIGTTSLLSQVLLSLADLGAPTTLGATSMTVGIGVSPDDLSEQTTLSSPSLSAEIAINSDDVNSPTTLSATDVSSEAPIAADDLSSALTLAPSALSIGVTLTAAGLSSTTTIDSTTVDSLSAMLPADLSVATTTGEPVLVPGYIVTTDDISSSTSLGATSIGLSALFLPDSLLSGSTLSELTIAIGATLTPASLSVASTLGATSLQKLQSLTPENIGALTSLSATSLSVQGLVLPADVNAPLTIGSPTVTGFIVDLSIDDLNLETKLGVMRYVGGPSVISVDALSRLLIIGDRTEHVLVVGRQDKPVRFN